MEALLPWHLVEEGDCIASIADLHGLPEAAVWDAPENADLRARRPDKNVLARGDAVFVPEPTTTPRALPTDARHRFRLKSAPVELRLRLTRDGAPLADLPYTLEVEGRPYPPSGAAQTDADGFVIQKVPASATVGTLSLPSLGRSFQIRIGHLEPVDLEAGLRARLRNLGFLGADDGAALREGLAAFQAAHALDPTGAPDDATRAKLREVHGS